MDESQVKPLKVGCWISKEKQEKFGWTQVAQQCLHYGVELILIDLSHDMESQGPFDCILQKVQDLEIKLQKTGQINIGIQSELENLNSYLETHQNIPVIDQISAVQVLSDRNRTFLMIQRYLEGCDKSGQEWSIPKFSISSVLENSIEPPYICKNIVAQGSRDCHQMTLVLDSIGNEQFIQKNLNTNSLYLFQKFINHSGILYKVFVIGEAIIPVIRKSIQNVNADMLSKHSFDFDSRDISKTNSVSELHNTQLFTQTLISHETQRKLSEIAQSLSQCFDSLAFQILHYIYPI